MKSPWLRWAILGMAIGTVLTLAPQALRFILFREGLPFGLTERFSISALVQDLGWRQMFISQLAWGPHGNETVEIGAMIVDYSPINLLTKTLDSVTVSDLTIHLVTGADGLRLRGVSEPQQQTTSRPTTDSDNWNPPVLFRQLDIRSGHILIHDQTDTTDIPFHFQLSSSKDQLNQLRFTAELLAGSPTPSIHGTLDLATRTVQAEFSCPLTSLASFRPQLAIPESTFAGRCNGSLAPHGRWKLALNATLSGPTKDGDNTISLPTENVVVSPIHLQGTIESQGPEGRVSLSGTVDRLTTPQLTLHQLSFTLPWSWPIPVPAETEGTITIATIARNTQQIGTLDLTVHQTDLAAGQIHGTFTGSSIFPSRLTIKAAAHLDPQTKKPQFDVSLAVPSLDLKDLDWQALSTLIDPQRTDTSPIGLAGMISATLTAQGNSHTHETEAKVSIVDGALTIPQEKVAINGVSGKIQLSQLLSESPGLKGEFSAQDASIADIHLINGEIQFHENNKDSLIVERVKAGWSGGTIHARDLRFTKDSRTLAGELYCDQLDLAQLLSQLGIPQVSGKGTISGRIPLTYSDGRIQISQGLLASNPGGGSLRLTAHELITGGIPPGSPQFGQLQFAAAALEDFTYSQMSMGLDSTGDEMIIAMSVDGHPAKPLPFRYDARLGTFSQIVGSGEIGITQPVKLDINFRLPLNELLGYGKSIKNLRDQLH